MKRRDFLIGSLVLCASASVTAGGVAMPQGVAIEPWLRERLSTSSLPRLPGLTGTLSDPDRPRLLEFFHYLGERWSLPASNAKRTALFEDLLSMKTSIAPSYVTEYREASAILAILGSQGLSPKAACERLLGPPGGTGGDENSRLGRARKFVSAEFIAWMMAKDGYARFGYQNYRGLMAGSFALQPPPYRHL